MIRYINKTPFSTIFDDSYFSLDDGLNESRYVFLEQNNMLDFLQNHEKCVICELGFGTGLNFLVFCEMLFSLNKKPKEISYISIEKYPIDYFDMKNIHKNWPLLYRYSEMLLEKYQNIDLKNKANNICFNDNLTLSLLLIDVQEALCLIDKKVDVWFFDGFSPTKNPQMWSEDVFLKVADKSYHGSRFATFSASGQVRRLLQGIGFEVEKVKGFGKKREMLRGFFKNNNL